MGGIGQRVGRVQSGCGNLALALRGGLLIEMWGGESEGAGAGALTGTVDGRSTTGSPEAGAALGTLVGLDGGKMGGETLRVNVDKLRLSRG